MEHLLPVSLVAPKEQIAKLGEARDVVQVQFFRRAAELCNRLVEGKLDSEQAIVLVDFDLKFFCEDRCSATCRFWGALS